MRVVVTGAAGMIGANLLRGLNAIGIDDIIAVDDLTRRRESSPTSPARRSPTTSTGATSTRASSAASSAASTPSSTKARAPTRWSTTAGSCSTTTTASRRRCSTPARRRTCACSTRRRRRCTAARTTFREEPAFERPLNVYGYSKLLFDQRRAARAADGDDAGRGLSLLQRLRPARAAQGPHGVGRLPSLQPVAERGPRQAVRAVRRLRRRASSARDFVSVDDVVAVNLWFLDHPEASGIFNLGSGRAQPFNDVAAAVVNAARAERGERAAVAGRASSRPA